MKKQDIFAQSCRRNRANSCEITTNYSRKEPSARKAYLRKVVLAELTIFSLLLCSPTHALSWSTPQVIANDANYEASIAVDADSNWHVVYASYGTSGMQITYISSASAPYVIVPNGGGIPSIDVDSNGALHVVYREWSGSSVMYTNNLSGPWSTPQEIADDANYEASIAVDADGNWHVVYASYGASGMQITYISSASAPYVIVPNGGGIPSIDVDSNGSLHVVYREWGGSSVMYTNNLSGSWSTPQVIANDANYEASIAADADGNWHVVYATYGTSGMQITYISSTSGPYVIVPNDGGIPSIDVDSNGALHVVYREWSGSSVMYTHTEMEPIDANIDIVADTITPKTKWITCHILPTVDYDVAEIKQDSILLQGEIPGVKPSIRGKTKMLVVKFPTSELNLEPNPDPYTLTVSGELTDGSAFVGSDDVTVVEKRGKKN